MVGSAAADAGSNGDCAIDETPSSKTSAAGCFAVAAIARETAPLPDPNRSARAADRTDRRSNRHPGADATDATTLEKIAADTHRAEPVSP
jgi:hypothetical protein